MFMCKDLVENIMDYIDNELDMKTLEELERHAGECPECRAFIDTYKRMLDLTGKHNMMVTYVRLALGEPVELQDERDVAADCYTVRDLDTVPGIFHADELWEGIHDARMGEGDR